MRDITELSASGPWAATASRSVGLEMYSVASQSSWPSVSASTTRAVNLLAHLAGRAHLTAESGAELRVFGQVGFDHLHRYPLAVWPLAEVHAAEAAIAKNAEQLERADVGRIPRLKPL